jgi:hypothetical protein
LSKSVLNVLDLNSSDFFNEILHLGLANLSVVVFIDGTEYSVELLLGKSVSLVYFGKVGNHKASHFSL